MTTAFALFAAALSVTLHTGAHVAPHGPVRLGDIATVSGPRAYEVAEAEVATAPGPGGRSVLERADVRTALARLGIAPDAVMLDGAPQVELIAAGQPIDVERLRGAAEEMVSRTEGARIVRLIVPGSVLVPEGDYSISVETPVTGLRGGIVRLPVVVRPAEGPEQRLSVSAQLELTGPVAVAVRDVPRGEPVAASDLRVEQRPIDAPAHFVADPAAAAGKVARATLRAGQPVPASAIAKAAAVEPGQSVLAILVQGSVTLTLRTTARGRGDIGALVPVNGPDGHKLLRGRVVGPGRVVLIGSQAVGDDVENSGDGAALPGSATAITPGPGPEGGSR